MNTPTKGSNKPANDLDETICTKCGGLTCSADLEGRCPGCYGPPRKPKPAKSQKPPKTVLLANDRLLLTIDDVAHLLQCTTQHVRKNLISDGLKRVKLGKQNRYRLRDVEAYVDALGEPVDEVGSRSLRPGERQPVPGEWNCKPQVAGVCRKCDLAIDLCQCYS